MNRIAEDDNIKIFFTPVGMLGSNATFIVDKKSRETIIVDAGNGPREIDNILTKEKLNLKLIIHTHAHFDHIGGSGTVANKHNVPIRLHEEDHELYRSMKEQSILFRIIVGEIIPVGEYIRDGEKISLKGSSLDQKLKAIYTPGHTKGGTSFYIESMNPPVLIAGDTLFKGSIGRTDLPGGDHKVLLHSIKTRLLTLPKETIVVTGHGPETTIGDEAEFNPFLQGL